MRHGFARRIPQRFEAICATLDAPWQCDDERTRGAARRARSGVPCHRACGGCGSRRYLITLLRDLTGRADLAEVCASTTRLAEIAIATAVTGALALALRSARRADRRGKRHRAAAASSSRWASSAAANSMSRPTSTSCSSIPKTARPRARSRSPTRIIFDRLGRRVIAALDEITADGFVFRVDMRLRPYGESGALSCSFAMLEQYLITQGRTWERYAWQKARPLTGDQGRGTDAAGHARSSTASISISTPTQACATCTARFASKAGARTMRGTSSSDLAASARSSSSCRRCSWCAVAAKRELRERGTLPALAALGVRGLLPAPAIEELRAALHLSCATSSIGCSIGTTRRRRTFPSDPHERDALARAAGFAGATAFDRAAAAPSRSAVMQPLRRDVRQHGRSILSIRWQASGWIRQPAAEHSAALEARGLRRAGGDRRSARAGSRPARAICSCPPCRASASTRSYPSCCACRGGDSAAASGIRAPARPARNHQRTQRLPRAARRASSGAAAHRATDGCERVGSRVPDAPSHPAR